MTRRPVAALAVIAALLAGAGAIVGRGHVAPSRVRGFTEQLCALPEPWLERIRRGYYRPRSGDLSLLPKTPAYLASGGGGWSHSGPWGYLQKVPLAFYGPGIVARRGAVAEPATLADVAPTLGRLLGLRGGRYEGRALGAVAAADAPRPALVVVIVWDGGGWNVLRQWPDAWPNLARLLRRGVSYPRATVGSSPSVTPAVHTTLGTGVYPRTHGITGVSVRDEHGEVVDSFLNGESGRFLRRATLAERWDEAHGNRARIGMIGYEPWHLGMIGMGAERRGGDRDDAVWLERTTNEWMTNERHYRLPAAVTGTPGLAADLDRLDRRDGERDGAWGEHAILADRGRIEETPAFVAYHARALENLVERGGYGDDGVTDMLFTNFKQIDRVGHYFNMASTEVRELVAETDRALGRIVRFLDARVGRSRYVVVVTADHGQQPDAPAVGGYGIDPRTVEDDVDRRFGAPVTRAVLPTEAFLVPRELRGAGVRVADVASYLSGYRLADNTASPVEVVAGAGRFAPHDRIFDLAVPARRLERVDCGRGGGR